MSIAYYRRWECTCECGSALAAVPYGERPSDLPECYPWPTQTLRCDCGGTLNLMDPEDRPEFYAMAPEMLKTLGARGRLRDGADRHPRPPPSGLAPGLPLPRIVRAGAERHKPRC